MLTINGIGGAIEVDNPAATLSLVARHPAPARRPRPAPAGSACPAARIPRRSQSTAARFLLAAASSTARERPEQLGIGAQQWQHDAQPEARPRRHDGQHVCRHDLRQRLPHRPEQGGRHAGHRRQHRLSHGRLALPRHVSGERQRIRRRDRAELLDNQQHALRVPPQRHESNAGGHQL